MSTRSSVSARLPGRRAPAASPFARRVLILVSRIPPGRVISYGTLARKAGKPGAARAVGNLMRTARQPGLPYHRVIAAGGRIGGYGGSEQLKASLLAAEGHLIRGKRLLHWRSAQWK